jgi:hypothetical protein
MRRGETAKTERRAVRRVDEIVSDELGWLFREQPLPDYGVDAQAEIVAEDELVTGRLMGLQIKGGDSRFVRVKGDEGWVFRDSNDHLAYWLGHSLPVLVVIVDPGGNAFWQAVTTSTIREAEKGFTVTIPRSQPFGVSTRDKLLNFAGRSEGLLESVPRYYAVLPPDAVGTLRRAEPADRLAAARLAERLASGRTAPGMTAASLTAARPSWLADSRAAQDLWLAVGGYAVEHDQDREAGAAFEAAADSEGPRSARARALAGLALLFTDRAAARKHLLRARADGQMLLADVGLPALDIPQNDARALDIPRSMLNATQAELDAEPTVLNFLAEMAVRRGDLNAGVSYRERAVAAAGDQSSVMRLALAGTIRRRAAEDGTGSSRELRRALGHAQAAVEERRRWDGPSAAALALLLDIQLTMGDATAVVTAALPASEGGTARDQETKSPDVAFRGGFAALDASNRAALDFFVQMLPDGPYRRELIALEGEKTGQPAAQRIAAWTAVAADAVDDHMAARAISRLAALGVWPPQAEDLRKRSILPQQTHDVYQAVYRAKSGHLDLGVAALRDLSLRSPLAAAELVQLLEQDVNPDSAIKECERQISRWQGPDLRLLYADLLRRHGRSAQAARLVERSVSDESLPADVRLSMCRWYVSRKAKQRKWAEVAAVARSGLAIGEDPALAWELVAALYNEGKIIEAREALARHQPRPGTQEEIRLWMLLHLGAPVTAEDARIMVDLANRQPDGNYRDAIIALLIREVFLNPAGTPFPKDIVDAAGHLAEQAAHRPSAGLQFISDDAALRAALAKDQPDPVAFQELLGKVRRGLSSTSDIARFTGRPYGVALLHRPAGILPASDLAVGLRSAGEAAASVALRARQCVVDLSSLHLLGLLPEEDRLLIRAALPDMVVAGAAVTDSVLTCDHMRGLSVATYTASLRADGTIERTTLTPGQQARLREQAEALQAATASLHMVHASERADPAGETVTIASEQGVPLWCDDSVLRQRARGARVPSFSLLDLVAVLRHQGTRLNEPLIIRGLAEQYVVDLPLNAADIVAVAGSHDWRPGPAHTALARPEWWRHHQEDWDGTWLEIATHARRHSPRAHIDMTKAALTGAIEQIRSGLRTQRYQQLLVLALVGCHDAGRPSPPALLNELAQHAGPGLAPRPPFVLTALIKELTDRSVEDPVLTARRLLPGVGLP